MKTVLLRRGALTIATLGLVGMAGLGFAHGLRDGLRPGLQSLDANADHAITRGEVEAAAAERFAAIDADRDGQITLPEIEAYRDRLRAERQAARLARLDANRDGRIDRAEFVAARSARLMRLDRNGDGVLDASDRQPRRDRG